MHTSAQPLMHVVDQHVEEAGHLSHVRQFLLGAAHPRLHALQRHDQRLAAHLDGVAVAGDAGWQACELASEAGAPGAMFVAGVLAIETAEAVRVERMVSLAQALPAAYKGLTQAFNWVSAQSLAGLVRDMLDSASALRRGMALQACVSHRVDAGQALAKALVDSDEGLRCIALRCAGDGGRSDLRDACVDQALDARADVARRFWAARAGLLLGERRHCPDVLQELASVAGPWRWPALNLVLKVLDATQATALVQPLGREPGGERAWVRSIGLLGDPTFVPWLIDRIADPALARLCGEAFTSITGCELDHPQFLLRAPDGELAVPPPSDAEGESAEMVPVEEDEGLPIADPASVAAWWRREGARISPVRRCLMGAPRSVAWCSTLLREGRQRQRMAAAEHLALLEPTRPLFNTAAPAWRQRRWLAEVAK